MEQNEATADMNTRHNENKVTSWKTKLNKHSNKNQTEPEDDQRGYSKQQQPGNTKSKPQSNNIQHIKEQSDSLEECKHLKLTLIENKIRNKIKPTSANCLQQTNTNMTGTIIKKTNNIVLMMLKWRNNIHQALEKVILWSTTPTGNTIYQTQQDLQLSNSLYCTIKDS